MMTPCFKTIVYINSFLLGAAVMSLEMLGSRYLNPYFGSSIYVWASLISTVLVAIALGALIGGAVADRMPNLFVLGGFIAVGAFYIAFIPFFFTGAAGFIAGEITSLAMGSLAASFALLFFPLFLLSVYTPFAIRLILHNSNASGTVSGRLTAVSTGGNIFGTLFTSFILIPNFGSMMITKYLAGLLVFSAASIFLYRILNSGKQMKQTTVSAILFILASASLAVPSHAADKALSVREFIAQNDGLIDQAETEYNNIYIYKRGDYLSMKFNLLGQDHLQSIMNVTKPLELLNCYPRLMIAPFYYVDKPRDVLMIGLGGGTIMRYIQHYVPGIKVTEVEIDRGVIRMAKKWFGITENANHNIIETDGRMFLSRNAYTYDIIMVDAFRASSIPFHLLTQEFYKLLLTRLKTGGAVVLNFNAQNQLFDSSLATIKTVFKNVDVYDAEGNAIVVAYNGRKLPANELKRRSAAFQARYKPLYNMKDIINHLQDAPYNASAPVLTDDYAPVEYLNVKRRP